MSQLPLFQIPILSVTELTRYLRMLLESDERLQDVWVAGEISNLSRPGSGHLYFTLKDSNASLRCVMWRAAHQRLKVPLADGAAVEVHGAISLYEQGGQYQLYADTLRLAGEGALYQEFLRLKARLEAEGLFDPARKRSTPALPRVIGIVTSPTGAALQDMLNTLRRRYPLAEVALAPTPVQGVEAPPGIVAAIQALNRSVHPDVILVARGGGSLEDLWAFNEESVARAIAASQAPIITGVGHETDFTIADFAADLRAPTPTAAAELATPIQMSDLRAGLSERAGRLERSLGDLLANLRWEAGDLRNRLRRSSPLAQVNSSRQRLDDLSHRAGLSLAHSLELRRAHLSGLNTRLEALSPLAVLERGYAVVTRRADGSLVKSVRQAVPGDELSVRVSDGAFGAQVAK